jgi:hypothetical protein
VQEEKADATRVKHPRRPDQANTTKTFEGTRPQERGNLGDKV